MTQAFTYFHEDGRSEIRIQPNGPLPEAGEVWVRGRYAPPDAPSPLDVRVGQAGIKVWMVIQWLTLSDRNVDTLLKGYGSVLTRDDVENALWYYQRNREVIDQRVQQEMQPV